MTDYNVPDPVGYGPGDFDVATQRRDDEQLRVLTIGHYVAAALAGAGLGFLGLHFIIFRSMTGGSQFGKMFALLPWFYGAAAILMIGFAIANLVSARCIRDRRSRMFSIILGGINCVHTPLGTLLGVMTIMVLSRDSVRAAYGE